jgi:UDP-N-acetylmuramyl pentapeptide phosphotransferase/UDP-N-acetylglucosamine-1-phosphate transferase
MLWVLFTATLVSLSVATWIIHKSFAQDVTHSGPQQVHRHHVSRVGGIALVAGWSLGLGAGVFSNDLPWTGVMLWWLCVSPVFAVGLLEDLTHKVSPLWRLAAAALSAVLASWLFGAMLPRLDLPWLDGWLALWPWLALALTWFAMAGVSHAFNIIDGYNGLSGMVALLVLGALGYVAFKVHDIELMLVCLASIGAVLGFLAWNYPRGLIFAGDGGAYFLGFIVALIAVLLVQRHAEVSAWFPLLLVIYPVWETVFSIYRRRMSGRAAVMPDALHLHQMIYRRLVLWMVGSREARHLIERNAMTSPYLWGVAAISIVPAVLFWQNTPVLILFCLIFVVFYLWLYRRLVRFRAPKWLITRSDPTNRR